VGNAVSGNSDGIEFDQKRIGVRSSIQYVPITDGDEFTLPGDSQFQLSAAKPYNFQFLSASECDK
jgi:hypothetical protein